MPRIGAFFGIVIYMYWDDVQRHHAPHFHARHGGDEAVFAIENGQILRGGLPKKSARHVRTWIDAHRAELGRSRKEH
ncbi:MAG: DUF4160 domain-containing protein [Rhodothermales bacterium]